MRFEIFGTRFFKTTFASKFSSITIWHVIETDCHKQQLFVLKNYCHFHCTFRCGRKIEKELNKTPSHHRDGVLFAIIPLYTHGHPSKFHL